jgi:hypothetical protein
MHFYGRHEDPPKSKPAKRIPEFIAPFNEASNHRPGSHHHHPIPEEAIRNLIRPERRAESYVRERKGASQISEPLPSGRPKSNPFCNGPGERRGSICRRPQPGTTDHEVVFRTHHGHAPPRRSPKQGLIGKDH